jgi:uncharacterized membrane protein
MNPRLVILSAFGIGVVGGLRSMTAPAVVAWAAHLGWMSLSGSPLAFMGSRWTVLIFTLAAFGEFVADLLPGVPARTSAFPLTARIVVGFLTGASMAVAGEVSLWLGGLVGAAGAIAGAVGGYQSRAGLVRTLCVADALIAIPEDLVAIGLGLALVSRLSLS